jgi:head-tail adaptor
MDSALLRHKLELHELQTTTSEYGTITTSYALKYTTHCHVIFNSENQVISEGEIFYPINRTFIVRSYVPVVETDRIKYEDKMYKILSINKNDYYGNIEIATTLVNE